MLPAVPAWAGSLLVLACGRRGRRCPCSRTVAALVALRRGKRRRAHSPRPRSPARDLALAPRARAAAPRSCVSDDVRAAAVLGLTSPIDCRRSGALAALEDEELDQIVVHEWAHVQRRDDIARARAGDRRALAGLHPAVWWIDRQLHLERETACDDWAVNATGSARALAVCLTKLAALPGGRPMRCCCRRRSLSSELTTRVVRLLDAPAQYVDRADARCAHARRPGARRACARRRQRRARGDLAGRARRRTSRSAAVAATPAEPQRSPSPPQSRLRVSRARPRRSRCATPPSTTAAGGARPRSPRRRRKVIAPPGRRTRAAACDDADCRMSRGRRTAVAVRQSSRSMLGADVWRGAMPVARQLRARRSADGCTTGTPATVAHALGSRRGRRGNGRKGLAEGRGRDRRILHAD